MVQRILKSLVVGGAFLAVLFFTLPASGALIHRYLMDDGTGTQVSDSAGTLHGTLTGGGTWTTGRFGGAVDCQSSGYIAFPSTNLPTTSGSFVQWVLVYSNAGDWTNPLTTHLQDPDYTPHPMRLEVTNTGTGTVYGIPNGAGGSTTINTGKPLRDGQWHQWVITYNHTTSQAIVYYDGLPVGSGTYSANGVQTVANWYMGIRYVGSGRVPAIYDNAAVYDHALSAWEVWQTYNISTDGVSLDARPPLPGGRSLQHLYVFDPQSHPRSDLLLDSVSGYHGMITGGTWSVQNPPQDRGAWQKTADSHNIMIPVAVNLQEGTYMGWFKSETSSVNWTNPLATSIRDIYEAHSYDSMRIEVTTSATYIFDAPGAGSATANIDTTDGQWHHLALVYKAGSPVQLYIDGVLRAQTGGLYNPNQAYDRGYTMIGSRATTGVYGWRGSVGTLAYFNYALSAGEINFYYTMGLVPEPSSLGLLALGGSGLLVGLARRKRRR